MDTSLEHEDLLIKLRAKLKEEKIKLWENPFIANDGEISQNLKDLSSKYAISLNINEELALQGLHELQLHSIAKLKANEKFKETGCATFQVRATGQGQKPRVLKISKQLSVPGEQLFDAVAELLHVTRNRVKLIYNGKLLKQEPSLQKQGIKNDAQIMALIMAETPEQATKEDSMYMQMKSTLDDATLLSEHVDDWEDDEEYMKLEDQSGAAVQLPPAERRALLVGLALHQRGRAAASLRDYALALVLLLEADRQFNECRSSLLGSVDNVAVLQLDIAWCYLCVRSIGAAPDAAARLARAQLALDSSYGQQQQRLLAVKGNMTNERVLFMRLYLLQGIVAFHQNKRAEAKNLLEKAEAELRHLKVDERAVEALVELGWEAGQARTGLRAAAGDVDRAHHLLEDRRREQALAREKHRQEREGRGGALSAPLLRALVAMGFPRRLAAAALRRADNSAADAVRLLHEQPELLVSADSSDEDVSSRGSGESLEELDATLLAKLEAMGLEGPRALEALQRARDRAAQMLAAGVRPGDLADPSTSSADASRSRLLGEAKLKRVQREMALRRLRATLQAEDDYLGGSLADEEHFLAQYQSLL